MTTQEHYDAIRQAKDELELKRTAFSGAKVDVMAMDDVPIEGKDHAGSCMDQYMVICDELDDLIAALQAELNNIDDQGGPDEVCRAQHEEMKADMVKEV